MINQEIILYGSALLVVAFGLLLIALVIFYIRLSGKHQELLKIKSKDVATSQRDIEAVLNAAQKKGQKIIQDSQERAQKIVAEAGSFSADTKKKMLFELERVSSEYQQSYLGLIEEAKVKTAELIGSLGQDIKKEAHLEVEAMRESLRAEIEKVQAETRAAIDAAYATVEQEIKAYKSKRIAQVDEEIFEIIRMVSEEVLGKALSVKEHEELIIKSLEDAKRQNIF